MSSKDEGREEISAESYYEVPAVTGYHTGIDRVKSLIQRDEVEVDDWGYVTDLGEHNLWNRSHDEEEVADIIDAMTGTHEVDEVYAKISSIPNTAYIMVECGDTDVDQPHKGFPEFEKEEVGIYAEDGSNSSPLSVLMEPGEFWIGAYSEEEDIWKEELEN